MFWSPWRTNYRGMTFTVRSLSRVLRGLSCPASIIVQPCSMRIRYRGSPSKSLFCEVLRSFLHSEGTTIYFPIPRRKTVPWSLKHRVSTQVYFLRGAAIIFAFRRHCNLFPNTSKEDCTVVAKTWRSFFCEVLRSFSHSEGTTIYFPIPQRKTVLWSLKQSPVFCEVLRSFSYSEAPTLYFPIDCTVVAKTSSVHPGLLFARCCDHFRIPKSLQFISQYLEGRLYRGR